MSNSRKVIRRKSVKEKTGLSHPQIWRKSADPDDDFPAAVRLGPSSIGWYESEIDAWLKSRPGGHVDHILRVSGYPLPFVVPWQTLGMALLTAVVIGIVASLLPARRAAGLNVLEAVGYE